jgi:transcription elongation factor Elf1
MINPLKKTFSCRRCNANSRVVKKVKQSTLVGVMQNGELPPSPK